MTLKNDTEIIKNVDRRPNYGPKTKFKMAAVAIFNLLPVAIFDSCMTPPPQTPPSVFEYCR